MAPALIPRWWSKDLVAVVTGSNKGIGYEIAKLLGKNGVTTVVTARDSSRGQKAVDSLKAEGLESVVFHPLDVTDAGSVDDLATWLKSEYGGLDILVNNAGIAKSGVTYENVESILDTNYFGVKTVTSKLLPLLRPGGRIVIVSSSLGQLSNLGSAALAKELGDEEQLNEEVADSFAKKYLEAVKAGTWQEDGWTTRYPGYSDSKVLLNAYMRSLAKSLATNPGGQKVFVNNVCPGYVATDLNNNAATEPASSGAITPVWLALLPPEHYPNGKFFKDCKELSF